MSGDDKEYKPYTTPYTGAGAVKTDNGWVNSRDFGPPGTTSGPGPGERRSSGPGPAFHHAELTGTSVSPPPDHENRFGAEGRKEKRSVSFGSGPIIQPGSGNPEIKGIRGPDGISFDLPKYHDDLASMSNKEIATKIGSLHIKKGSIHENMHQAATSQDILARDPQAQLKLRDENARQLNDIEAAIRAWEEVQAVRTQNIPTPGLVDMLMMSQDLSEKQRAQNQQSARNTDNGSNKEHDGTA